MPDDLTGITEALAQEFAVWSDASEVYPVMLGDASEWLDKHVAPLVAERERAAAEKARQAAQDEIVAIIGGAIRASAVSAEPENIPLRSGLIERSTERRIVCPVHGIFDCSPLLNGCSLVNQLHDSSTKPTGVDLIAAITEVLYSDLLTIRAQHGEQSHRFIAQELAKRVGPLLAAERQAGRAEGWDACAVVVGDDIEQVERYEALNPYRASAVSGEPS